MSADEFKLLAQKIDFLTERLTALEKAVAAEHSNNARNKLILVGAICLTVGICGSHPSAFLSLLGVL